MFDIKKILKYVYVASMLLALVSCNLSESESQNSSPWIGIVSKSEALGFSLNGLRVGDSVDDIKDRLEASVKNLDSVYYTVKIGDVKIDLISDKLNKIETIYSFRNSTLFYNGKEVAKEKDSISVLESLLGPPARRETDNILYWQEPESHTLLRVELQPGKVIHSFALAHSFEHK